MTRLAILAATAVLWAGAYAQEGVPEPIKAATKRADDAVAKIIAVPKSQRNFANTLGALDDISTRLANDTSLFLFQQYVSTDAKTREESRAADEWVTNWEIGLGKREDLYKAIKEYADTKPNLSGEEARFLEFTMRDYRRAGMELPKDKRDRLQAIEVEMNKLGIEFSTNIYEDETIVALTKEELKGVPEDVVKGLKQAGGLYLVSMDGPTYSAVLDYAEDETARQRVWLEYKRRGGKKNVALLEKVIKLRAEAAQLLGFKNTVDWQIETRMAKNSENVAKFYTDLRPIVREKAKLDFAEFTEAKRKHTGDPNAKLQWWDYGFYLNRLKKEKYAVDGEKVAEYFPMEAVVSGIFDITSTLYNIEYKDVTSKAKELGLPIWHEDVKLYEIYDKSNKELLGRLYTDLYPRDNKYNHAACWGLHQRKAWADGKVQKPLAALVCNFTKPTADKPSLLPHDEVETFFHEFGHGLHQILTQTKLGRFSGTAVERDFVEAPSQMMENWIWDGDVLAKFTKHYKTGEPLPAETLKGMLAARSLGKGIEVEHQIYYGMVDQAYHTSPNGVVDTTQIGIDLMSDVELFEGVPETWYQAAFGHMIGYQSAYYGYLWSLVYAQDMYQRFDELGVLSPETGMYYRNKVLGRGGSMDGEAMLRDYLGREPKMDAFLKYLGVQK
jgi:thimet oligopeptidase